MKVRFRGNREDPEGKAFFPSTPPPFGRGDSDPACRDEDGQSLLEVLISIVFMAAILLMSLNFMVAGVRGNSVGREMSTATYLAQEVLEEMRTADFSDLGGFDGFVTGGSPPGGEPARSICEDWEEEVTGELPSGQGEIDVDITGGLARVTVTVDWVGGADKQRQVSFETMIAARS